MLKPISCFYKCKCVKEEVEVKVLPRKPDEDLEHYMQLVLQPSLYLDHRNRSPNCKEVNMEYMKVPYTEELGVGSSPKLN